MRKYEFTDEKIFFTDIRNFSNHTLHRIRAVRDFGDVRAGDLGGWIEKEENLSHTGDAWVGGEAQVTGAALVTDDALVTGNAQADGQAIVSGDAWIGGEAQITGTALLTKEADYVVLKGFGPMMHTATFFRCEDGRIRAKCEDFYGDMREFRAWAKKSKMAKEYMMIADLIDMHFTTLKGEHHEH